MSAPGAVFYSDSEVPGAVFYSDTQNGTPRHVPQCQNEAPRHVPTHSGIAALIGRTKLIFLSVLKSYFPDMIKTYFSVPNRAAIPECVGTWRGVSFCDKGNCAVFHSV